MNAMELFFSGGLQQMCMFHEPKGFGPTIFLHIFSGALKIHFPVSWRALVSLASSEKVNWSTFNFNTTSREHANPLNPPFCHKALPKSEKNACFWGSVWLNSTPGTLTPVKRGVIESGSSYNPVLIRPRESEGHKLDWSIKLGGEFLFSDLRTVQWEWHRNHWW